MGRLGTALPGEIALKIYPPLLAELCAQKPVTLVTGTNGKSSVSALLAQMLRAAGLPVIHNTGGANMASGLVTALGLHREDLAQAEARSVFEIDEAWFAKLAPEIKPSCLLVTNLFRDQVDRNGDVQAVRDKIAQGIRLAQGQAPHFQLILNADDPYVASLAHELPDKSALFFGLAWPQACLQAFGTSARLQDLPSYVCPLCGADLVYRQRSYDHVGLYHCSQCSFTRPQPDLTLRPGQEAGLYMLEYQGQDLELQLGPRQDYMLYNLAAAALAALQQGAELASLARPAQEQEGLAGRDELVDLGQDRQAQIRLVKNPVGLSLGLEAMASDSAITGLCIMVNNKESDGQDISWLQEVNYQPLLGCQDRLDFILLSGSRAEDLSKVLKAQGCKADLLQVEPQVGEAWTKLQDLLKEGSKLMVLPNYTTMWELQAILKEENSPS